MLNITPDHLDRYEYKMENYIQAKFNLTKNMDGEGVFIFYNNDPVLKEEIARREIIPKKVDVILWN